MREGYRFSVVWLLLLILTACGAPAQAPAPTATFEQAELPTRVVDPEVDASGGELEAAQIAPLDAERCRALQTQLETRFARKVTQEELPYQDMFSTQKGTACHLALQGTGAELGSFTEVVERVHLMLAEEGWEIDNRYAADGPFTTLTGFQKERSFCLAEVGWEPAPEVECPTDEPVVTCQVPPEQQNYTISLSCVQYP